jgi:hypothetical protein
MSLSLYSSEAAAFVERAFQRLPVTAPSGFTWQHWNHAGRPTDEGFGLLPVPGLDPQKVMDCVMDVDHYVGNLDHVVICRSVSDSRFGRPHKVRAYQKVDIPMLGGLHHEFVLERAGQHRGYEVAAWALLGPETSSLSSKDAARSDYSLGAWIAAPGMLGYALASAPRREDVGLLKWKALTAGADVAASKVLRNNLEVMARWASRR